MYIILLILRIITDTLAVDEDIIFNKLTIPAQTGKIPNGSGELKSVNQSKPSVKMAGLSV